MADVYTYVIDTGLIIPDTGAIQAQVIAEYQQIFGSDLVYTPNTPQGLLITAEVAARVAVANNNAALANQINPNYAGGIYADAIGALTNSPRTPATPSTVVATLTGVTGTIIPVGSQAQDSVYANLFQTTTQVTIAGGTATVVMQSLENGPIVAGAGTLTQIVSDILGWESVTNADAAVLGTSAESDAQYLNQRRVTLAAQGASTAAAIISAVNQVQGVTSMSFLENVASTTQTIDGVVMVSHSIYACVAGGTDLDVANAMQSKKSAGAAYNNGASSSPISQDVVVPYSNQIIAVLFDRPDIIQVGVAVSVKLLQPIQNAVATVQEAILAYCNGELSGLSGLIVGANVSPWELAGAITTQYPGIYVQSLQIQLTASPGYQYTEIVINPWEQAKIQQSAIIVTVL